MIILDSDFILNFKNENFLILFLDIKLILDFFFFIDGSIIYKFLDILNGDIFVFVIYKGFIDDIMDYLFLYEGFDVIVFFNFLRLFKFEDVYVVIGKKGMYCFFINVLICYLFIV